MAGIQLSGLDASDMLDVLHYYFEEDTNHASSEQARIQSATRTHMYENLYNEKYKYGLTEPSTEGAGTSSYGDYGDPEDDDDYADDDVEPFNPRDQGTKAYTPPTKFDASSPTPFGQTLDSPLN